MPSAITDDTLNSFLGIGVGPVGQATPEDPEPFSVRLDSFLGITPEFTGPPSPPKKMRNLIGSRDLSDEERQQIVSGFEPTGFVEQTILNTTPGAIARGLSRAYTENVSGVPYEEVPNRPLNLAEKTLSTTLSLLGDPVTYGAGALGKMAGEYALGKHVASEAWKQLVKRGSIEGATMFGTMTAAKQPFEQYAEKGEVSLTDAALETGKSVTLGTLLGPAAITGKFKIPAEILAFSVGGPGLEGRLPTPEDFVLNAGVILGARGAGKVAELGKRLATRGPDELPLDIAQEVLGKEDTEAVLKATVLGGPEKALLNDYKQRVAAGQKDPMPSADAFEAAGKGRPTRKQRGPIIEELLAAETQVEIPKEPIIPEGNVPPDVHVPMEIKDATGEVKANEEVQSGRPDAQGEATSQAKGQEAAPVNDVLSGGDSTSLKNAVREADRATRGLSPVETPPSLNMNDVWEQAKVELQKNPNRGYELVDELNKNPRTITPLEDSILKRHDVDLINRDNDVLDKWVEANRAGRTEEADALMAESKSIEEKRQALDEAAKLGGTEWGRAGRFRQTTSDFDYNLSTWVKQDRMDTGGKLSPDEWSKQAAATAELNKALQEDVRKQAEIDALEAEKATEQAIKSVETKVKRERSARSAKAKAEFDAAWKEVVAEGTGTLFSVEATIKRIPSMVKLAKAWIKMKGAEFADFYDEIKSRIGEAKANAHKDLWEEAWRIAVAENKPKADRRNLTKAAGLSRFAHELAKHFVETGVKDRDALIDALHEELAKAVPGITRVETAAALVKYGQIVPLSKGETNAELRRIKGELRQVLKLNDMVKGRAPKASGIKYPTPEAEERRLIQQVNEAKKKGGYKVTDPERQLKSALQARETHLKNQIADLESQIAKGERNVKERTEPPTNKKIEAMQAQVEALREQLDAIAPKPELTDAQRLQRYKEALTRREAALREQIASGNVDVKPSKRIELDSEAEKARRRVEELLERRAKMRAANQYRSKTKIEKVAHVAGDILGNVQRAIVMGFDLTFLGLQAGAFHAAHPIRSLREDLRAFESMSERRRSFYANKRAESPNAKLYRRMKIRFTDPHGKPTAHEEIFVSSLIDRIPGLKHLSRFSSELMNGVRQEWADVMAKGLSKDGKTLSDKEARDIGSGINIFTSRGNLGDYQGASNLLHIAFTAPRHVLSRFQIALFQPMWKGNARTRIAFAKEYARMALGLTGIYSLVSAGLYAAYGPPGKDKEWDLKLSDPTDREWGQIRVGSKLYDMTFGLRAVINLMARTGARVVKDDKEKSLDPLGGFGFFIRSKMAPWPKALVDRAKGETISREKATWPIIVRDLVFPITPKEVIKEMEKLGVPRSIIDGLIQGVGVGVTDVYKNKAS